MSKSISLISGSVLIGSPIVVNVVPDTLSVAPTFHRVKLIVSASLLNANSFTIGTESFELSEPVDESGAEQTFDISSALRTVARNFQYNVVTGATTYPYLQCTLSAHDEYMVDGILHENVNVCNYAGTIYAIMGAATGLERYLSNGILTVTSLTRKPSVGEICGLDETLVYPATPAAGLIPAGDVYNPNVSVATLNAAGKATYNGRTIYVDGNATNRAEFQFVNGLGVVESASAEFLETKATEGSSEMYTVAGVPDFGNPVRLAGTKSDRNVKIKCSSGFVNADWAKWWHDEFLGSDDFRCGLTQSCWIKLDGVWQPCVCSLDDDTTIYDKTKAGMLHIDFTVHLPF